MPALTPEELQSLSPADLQAMLSGAFTNAAATPGSAMNQSVLSSGLMSGQLGLGDVLSAGAQTAGSPMANFQQQEQQRINEGTAGMTPEQYAQYQQLMANDARFGNDMSWLDPSFQYSPNLLGQSAGSQVFTDPALQAQQQSLLNQNQSLANTNLNFQNPAVQQGLMNQWAAIQGGQGAPTFMGNAQQTALMNQLLGVAAPNFKGDGDQRAVLNAAMGFMNNSGPGSLQFDTSGRQGEQYGNLQDIIKGGGATAIEMAQRQKARADSEAWLRGQREADMADYAERGLTGSGMELLNLAADRQAAAGRNSAADLATSAALEERRLGAINSAAGLATNMRGQTIDEQGLLNNRAMTGLSAASSLSNSMRDADIREQLGLNNALQTQFTNAANISGQMRTQDYNERSYLDKRTIDALSQQTDLSSKMRDQLAFESVANRTAQQNALNSAGSLTNQMRTSQAQEGQYRADAADKFSTLNQAAINKAAADNTSFLQDAYKTTMNNRSAWDINNVRTQADLGVAKMNFDASENRAASGQNTQVGTADAAARNKAVSDLRASLISAGMDSTAVDLAMKQFANQIYGQAGEWQGDVAGTVGQMGLNAASMPSGGGGGSSSLPTAGSTSLSMPTGSSNPYGVGVGGGSTGNPYGVSAGGTASTGGYGAGLGGYSGQLQLDNLDLTKLKSIGKL